jgi:uncharacterized protein
MINGNARVERTMIGSANNRKGGRATLTLIAMGIAAFLYILPSMAAEKFPVPRGAVNDYAHVIYPDVKTKMENLSREVLDKTGTSIVVAVMPTIGENDVRAYTNELYRKWGIGEKGKDKGVLIFLAVKEKQVRIEIGYGVEGILPDGLVGEILDESFMPAAKAGDYAAGLYNTQAAVAAVIAKDAHVTLAGNLPVELPRTKKEKSRVNIVTIILIVLAFIVLMATPQGRDMLPWLLLLIFSGRGGGGRGGFGDFGGGGFGGFGGGDSGGGGADRSF